MDIKKQAVSEYLTQGFTYRQLADKYGVSRSTINTWVLVHQGINDLPRSKRQHSYDLQQMKQGKNAAHILWPTSYAVQKKTDGSGMYRYLVVGVFLNNQTPACAYSILLQKK